MNASAKPALSSSGLPAVLGDGLRSPVTHTFATTLLIVAFGLLSGIQLARGLGPQGRGEVAAALLWPGLLIYLGSLGLSQAVVVFAANTADRDRVSQVLSTATSIGLGLGTLVVLVGLVLIPLCLRSQSADVVRASRMFLPTIPAGILSGIVVATLQGRSSFVRLNLVRLVTPAGYVVGIAALTYAHRLNVLNVVFVQLLLSYVTFVIGYAFLFQNGIRLLPIRFEMDLAKRLLDFGVKAYIGTATGTINQRLDQALLVAWFPAEQVGIYSVAVSASGAADTIGFAFRTVASARIAQKIDANDKFCELCRVLGRFGPIMLSGTVVLALLLPILIPLLYGSSFRGSILPAEILLIATALYTTKNLLTSAAEAFGDSWLGSKAELIGLGPTVLLMLMLVPKFGIMGAAYATLFAYAIQLTVMIVGFRSKRLALAQSATATVPS